MLVRRDVYVSAESSREVRVATVTQGGPIRFQDRRLSDIEPSHSAVVIHFIGGNHFDAWVLRHGSFDNTASITELNRIAEIVRQQRVAIVTRRRLQANVAAALGVVSSCLDPCPDEGTFRVSSRGRLREASASRRRRDVIIAAT